MKSLVCDGCHSKIEGDCLGVIVEDGNGIRMMRHSFGLTVVFGSCCSDHGTTTKGGKKSDTQNFVYSNAQDLSWCSFLCFVSWAKKNLTQLKCDERLGLDAVKTAATRKEMTT